MCSWVMDNFDMGNANYVTIFLASHESHVIMLIIGYLDDQVHDNTHEKA
jgi:hypothetical protein